MLSNGQGGFNYKLGIVNGVESTHFIIDIYSK